MLDGQEVKLSENPVALPPGFRELYRVTEPFVLVRGKHELRLLNEAREYPYLPAAFLLGHFSATPEKELFPLVGDPENFYGYCGKVTREMVVEIPEKVRFIYAPQQRCGGEIFLDGQSLGCCLQHPFRWAIPTEYRGQKVTLRCEYRTACGQLFGEKIFRKDGADPVLKQFAPDNSSPFVLPELFMD